MTDTAPIGTTLRIPIADIIVDPNIRRVTKVPPAVASSIKQDGVLEPVDAYQDEDGRWHLQDGQLRYLASLDAGHTDIPVLVNDPALAETAKLMRQLIKNELRTELTDADRANTYQTLFDLGVSADAIARKTKAPKKQVERALQVKASEWGAKTLEEGAATLDQLAAIIEFEEAPEIAERLIQQAVDEPQRFPHALERAKQDLDTYRKRQARIDQLAEEHVPLLEQSSPEFSGATSIDYIYTDEALTTPALGNITADQGLRGVISELHGWRDGGWETTFVLGYYVVNPAEHGLFTKKHSTAGKPEMTDEQKTERKKVVSNNKAWPLATTVRQEWIRDNLLQRATLPEGTSQFIATGSASGHPRDSYASGLRKAAEWLGLSAIKYSLGSDELLKEIAKGPAQATRVSLALTLANAELKIEGREGWRTYDNTLQSLVRYLIALAAFGYGLSDVEESVIADAKAAKR